MKSAVLTAASSLRGCSGGRGGSVSTKQHQCQARCWRARVLVQAASNTARTPYFQPGENGEGTFAARTSVKVQSSRKLYAIQERLQHAKRIHHHVAKAFNKRHKEREAAIHNLRKVLYEKAKDARPRWLRLYRRVMTSEAARKLVAGLNNHLKVVVGHIAEQADSVTHVPADITELRQASNPQVTRSGHMYKPPRGRSMSEMLQQ